MTSVPLQSEQWCRTGNLCCTEYQLADSVCSRCLGPILWPKRNIACHFPWLLQSDGWPGQTDFVELDRSVVDCTRYAKCRCIRRLLYSVRPLRPPIFPPWHPSTSREKPRKNELNSSLVPSIENRNCLLLTRFDMAFGNFHRTSATTSPANWESFRTTSRTKRMPTFLCDTLESITHDWMYSAHNFASCANWRQDSASSSQMAWIFGQYPEACAIGTRLIAFNLVKANRINFRTHSSGWFNANVAFVASTLIRNSVVSDTNA